MIEIIITIAAVVLTVKVADLENRSVWAWGFIALIMCLASWFVPFWPCLRVLIAGVLVFVLMAATTLLRKA